MLGVWVPTTILESFSYEWSRFRSTQLDSVSCTHESRDAFVAKTGFNPTDLVGKLVLDAGCGMGRYAEVVVDCGGQIVAVDASTSVEWARQNVPEAQVLRANIFNLPFEDGTFDFIFSLGVLHHTPDARRAFLSLCRLLKPGGEIAIWVYSNEGVGQKAYNLVTDFYRLFTTKMPLSTLYTLSHLAVPFYHAKRIPIIGRAASLAFPCSSHPIPEWRVLDTFDWYSPKYQSKHTYDEVTSWFREAGLHSLERLPTPVSVKGRMPIKGEL